MCGTVCLCESIFFSFFSQTVCSIHQVYMKYITLAVESLEGTRLEMCACGRNVCVF